MLTKSTVMECLIFRRLYIIISALNLLIIIPLFLQYIGCPIFVTEHRVTYVVYATPSKEWTYTAFTISSAGISIILIYIYLRHHHVRDFMGITPFLLSHILVLICSSGVNWLWPLALVSCSLSIALFANRDMDLLETGLNTILLALSLSWFLRTLSMVLDLPIPVFLKDVAPYFWGFLQPSLPIVYLLILAASLIKLMPNLLNQKDVMVVHGKKIKDSRDVTYAIFGALLASTLYVLPYTIILNPSRKLVTEDIVFYTKWLKEMEHSENPILYAFLTDRPIYLLILYWVKNLFGMSEWLISTISGWLWSPLVTASLWFLSRELYGSDVSKWVALLTPLSHQGLVFLYGGFQANQLNLSILYTVITLIVRPSSRRIIVASILMLISSGIHIWSWIQIGLPIIGWLIYEYTVTKHVKSFKWLLAILTTFLAPLLLSIHKISYLPHKAEGVEFKLSNFPLLYINLSAVFSYYLWGTATSSAILLIVALYHQVTHRRRRDCDILDWLNIVALLGTFIFSGSVSLITRLYINTPVQVLAAREISKCTLPLKTSILILTASFSIYLVVNAIPS